MTIEYNQFIVNRKSSMFSKSEQKMKQKQSWQLTSQLYGPQEMVKRTVDEIFRKTYNLHATKDEQSRKTFSQHKTWAALQSDPLFKNSLNRRKSQNDRDRMAAISKNEPQNRRSFTTNNKRK